MLKRNIKLTIEYDGTNFCGWQKQPNGQSIQQALEDAIYSITKENVNIVGSGRTDSKVHAFGQVANFYTSSKIPQEKFTNAINSKLPSDISVKDSIEVPCDFHSRYGALGKEYKYIIYNDRTRSPILRNYSYHVPYELNIGHMKNAIESFRGTYDFRGFMSTGSSVKSTIRTINKAELNKKDEIIEITLQGNGFLYNMVRIITGTLVEIGMGKICHEKVFEIIMSQDRKCAGHTAPPQGLYLNQVFY
ncbi:tRNA pseudouridine synthase A [Gottschalkia acidurici 9a]|uniref:tRNA pseudouridine synthase A n=1 Tax=Gottschalkia acidurici (strain ATCC 7906 / DSM 604 / BCRC 14475 / CIP 104303 / KCTC 5404 / NCIMB 10678 / 9a) TaxID=1128398 RepID=K0AZK6_GOTA9|nr:tRNA pseudouridine(38-40) synthase TruA [Gottschalkia acidurici]AFS79233.1 tRNA pseudouridine synthase A [Gottschalkia acidurici 9a]